MSDETKFTALEKKLLFEFLDELSDHYGNAGCNDFEVPNTVEGRALFTAAVRYSYSEDDANRELAQAFEWSGGAIATVDSTILGYLRHKLEVLMASQALLVENNENNEKN